MPLVNPQPPTPPEKAPSAPVVAKPEYKGTTVDTRYEPNSALLTHVEGSAWTVDYYSQVLDQDSALSGQNVTQAAIYQQYTLIKGFELRVSAALSTSQDDTTKAMVMTGSANVYPFVIPNEGDMFLADIGDGREGVFKITRSERKSVFKEAIHAIEYQLIDYSTVQRRSDLNAKVVKKLHFARNFLSYGQNPLLQEDDYAIIKELEGRLQSLTLRYFDLFSSTEFRTMILPGQPAPVYDHFLVSTVMALFNTYDAPEIRYIRKLNVGGDNVMKSVTIWDVIRERDISLLKFCNLKAGLVDVRTFDNDPVRDGIFFSGIRYVVYPVDPEAHVDDIYSQKKRMSDVVLIDTPSKIRKLSDLIGDKEFVGLSLPDSPPIHKVTIDDYYVLSQNFYDNTDQQSLLERCVRDYLEGKAPNTRALLALCNTYHAWGSLERFYYVPLVLMLIKATIRSF